MARLLLYTQPLQRHVLPGLGTKNELRGLNADYVTGAVRKKLRTVLEQNVKVRCCPDNVTPPVVWSMKVEVPADSGNWVLCELW